MSVTAPASTPLASTPPTASLSTVPPEIKARIVALAKAQDTAYLERTKGSSYNAHASTWNESVGGGWYGRSVIALSLVSREFNVLAGRFIFDTFHSDQLREEGIETLGTILARHSTSIRAVQLHDQYGDDEADRQEMLLALGFASTLPNVQQLIVLDGRLMERIDADRRWFPVKNLIRGIAGKITGIELPLRRSPRQVGSFIGLFPNLKRIKFGLSDLATDASLLVDALRGLGRSLRHLDINHYLDEGFPEPWTSFTPETLPLLNSLTLFTPMSESSHIWRFILPFAPSLETLDIECGWSSLAPPPTSLSSTSSSFRPRPVVFPKLRYLRVAAGCTFVEDLSKFSFPAVHSLDFVSHAAFSSQAVGYRQLLKVFPHLQQLILSNCSGPGPRQGTFCAREFIVLKDLVTTNNSSLSYVPLFSTFHPSKVVSPRFGEIREAAQAEEEVAAFGLLEEEFKSLSDFLVQKTRRLMLTDDKDGLRKMIPALKGLNELKEMERD